MGDNEDTKSLKPHWFQILLSLADKDLHGYGIRNEVLERTDSTMNLWPGMLYRTIRSLVDADMIEECPAPGDAPSDARERNYYRILPEGQRALAIEAARMAAYVEVAREKEILPDHG